MSECRLGEPWFWNVGDSRLTKKAGLLGADLETDISRGTAMVPWVWS